MEVAQVFVALGENSAPLPDQYLKNIDHAVSKVKVSLEPYMSSVTVFSAFEHIAPINSSKSNLNPLHDFLCFEIGIIYQSLAALLFKYQYWHWPLKNS